MKTSIIQLDANDDVLSIRDKVSWSKTSRILLVWPAKPLFLQHLELVLILRACQQQGAQLALVTDEKEITFLAQELSIPVFTSLKRAQRVSWRHPRGKKAPVRRGSGLKLPEKPTDPAEPTWQDNRNVRYGAVVIGMAAILALIFLFLPSAKVNLFPQREFQTLNLEIRPSLNVKTVNVGGGVPAAIHSVIVEGEESRPSSGSMIVPLNYSVGRVVFTNLTEENISLPQGLILATTRDPSIRFRTIEPAQLAGRIKAQIDVRVQAVRPGQAGNIPAGSIKAVEDALGSKVSVTNPDATLGGNDGMSAAPTTMDRELLRENLLAQLRKTAVDDLAMKTGAGYILEPSVQLKRIIQETSEPEPQLPSDNLKILIRAEFQAWVVQARDLQDLAKRSLDASLPENKRSVAGSLKIIPAADVLLEGDSARWQLAFSREIEDAIDENRITSLIKGRSPEEAIALLEGSFTFRKTPEITLEPAWWPVIPFLTFRITVNP